MATPESHTLQAIDTLPEDKDKGGRPSTYSEAVGALICARIAGGETLSAICRTPGLPARQTVLSWRRQFAQFDADYLRARVDQMEAWSDDIIEISDDSSMDTVTKRDPKGREFEAVDHENIQRSKLMVNTRQWVMAKLAPRYADRVDHKHSGEVVHTVELSDRERMRRLATFMLEDRAAGVTIEGELGPAAEPIPASSPSPADIVAGAQAQD